MAYVPMVIAVWVLWPLASAGLLIWARRAQRRTPRGQMRCFDCRYDLAGIVYEARACPECGLSLRGRPVLRADDHVAERMMNIGSLGLVWWMMTTLTIVGVGWVVGMTIAATFAEIP